MRPDFLRWLATDPSAQEFIDPQGIRVVSAIIANTLDLSFCKVSQLLQFRDCIFNELFVLLHSDLRGLCIYSSVSRGILAHGAKIHGPVFFLDGFESHGSVEFHSAAFEQAFDCRGATLTSSGISMILDHATIRGGINLGQGFSSYRGDSHGQRGNRWRP